MIFGPRWQEGRIEAIENRLEKLESKIQELKRQRREVLTEWESTFEKFNALWARLSKRIPRESGNGPGRAKAEPPTDAPEEQQLNPLAIELWRRR